MNSFKVIRTSWAFYRNFVLFSSIITIACLRVLWLVGLHAFFGVFWLKIATLGVIYHYINSYKKNEFYYYQNLGISKALLWVITFSLDLLLFLISIILLYKNR